MGRLGLTGDVLFGARMDVNLIWSVPGWSSGNFLNGPTVVADRLYFVPIFVGNPVTYDRVGIFVPTSAASSLVRLGLYSAAIRNAGDGLLPDVLLEDYGTVSSATTGQKEITINDRVARGYYFTAFISDGIPVITGLEDNESISTVVEGHNTSITSMPNLILAKSGQTGVVSGGMPDPAPLPMTEFLTAVHASVFYRSETA